MKTLILNGSPTKNGDTVALLGEFTKHLRGDIKLLSHYDGIPPCVDCRCCWSHKGCCATDPALQDLYAYLDVCDNVVLASPIWFSSLSGPLLNLASRAQALWANNYFLKEPYASKIKNGGIIIIGAQEETKDIPTQTALAIMKYMNVDRSAVQIIYSLHTNDIPAAKDTEALEACRATAERLNELCTITPCKPFPDPVY